MGSRAAAQAKLIERANLQEMIFLNSNLCTGSVAGDYTGFSGGGLGVTSGTADDGRYTWSRNQTSAAAA
jgi:hypothetical protein